MNIIPRSLMEQLKDKDEFLDYTDKDLDRLYLLGQLVGQDRLTQLYAMVDEGKKIRGFLWLSIDPVTLNLWVTLLVIEKGYQNYKRNIENVFQFSKKIKDTLGLKKLKAMSGTPKALQRITGAKPSKLTVVEVV